MTADPAPSAIRASWAFDEDADPGVGLITGLEGQIRWVSAASAQLVGWRPAELLGRTLDDLLPLDDLALVVRDRATLLRQPGSSTRSRVHVLRPNGDYQRVELVSSLDAHRSGVVSSVRAPSPETALLPTSGRVLSGTVTTRAQLVGHLGSGLKHLTREPGLMAALDLEVAPLNAGSGASEGQPHLALTHRVLQQLRGAESWQGPGPHELLLVVALPSSQALWRLTRRLTQLASEPVVVAGKRYHGDVRIGVSSSTCAEADPAAVLRSAQQALRQAKRERLESVRFVKQSCPTHESSCPTQRTASARPSARMA